MFEQDKNVLSIGVIDGTFLSRRNTLKMENIFWNYYKQVCEKILKFLHRHDDIEHKQL